MTNHDIEHRMLPANGPEAKGIVGVLRAIQEMQVASGNYDVLPALSMLTNAAGHLLATSSLPEAEIDRLAKSMRQGVTGVVAELRRTGDSPLIKATVVPKIGRA